MSGVGCGFCSSEGTVGFVGVVEPWVFVCVCVVGKKWLLSCVCCEDGIVCGWSIEEGGHPKCSLALSSL